MSPAKKSPAILTVDQIIEADDLLETVVEVPEWGGAVKMKQITRSTWNGLVDGAIKGDEFDAELFDLNLLIATITEPKLTPDRAEQLRKKNAGVVRRLCVHAHKFNNVNEGALEAAEARFQDDE